MQARAQIRQTGILALAASASLFAADYDWRLRTGFPRPTVPADNPMTAEKVELGRHLFYDKRMSVNGRQSCASCHSQQLAFTDGRATAQGATGEIHPRSSMSLVNIAYSPLLTWAHPKLDSLEEQVLVPMLGTDPIELGLKGREGLFLAEVRQDVTYRRLFPAAFSQENNPYTIDNVVKAIASSEASSRPPLHTIDTGIALLTDPRWSDPWRPVASHHHR